MYTLELREYPLKNVKAKFKDYPALRDAIYLKYVATHRKIKFDSRTTAYLRKYGSEMRDNFDYDLIECLFEYGTGIPVLFFVRILNFSIGGVNSTYAVLKYDDEEDEIICINIDPFNFSSPFTSYPDISSKEHFKKKIELELGCSCFDLDSKKNITKSIKNFKVEDDEPKEEKITYESKILRFNEKNISDELLEYINFYIKKDKSKNKPFNIYVSFKTYTIKEVEIEFFKCSNPKKNKVEFRYIGVSNPSMSIYYDERGARTVQEQYKIQFKDGLCPTTSKMYELVADFFYDKLVQLGLIEEEQDEIEEIEEEVEEYEEELEEEEEVIPQEEVQEVAIKETIDLKKTKAFEEAVDRIDYSGSMDDETRTFSYCFNLYKELNSLEKDSVKSVYEYLEDSYNEYLYKDIPQTSKKEVVRKVYVSKSYLNSLKELYSLPQTKKFKEEIDNLCFHLIHDDLNALSEFLRYKNINKTKEFKKIRIINTEIPRIVFLWGNDFKDDDKDKKAIYLVDIILDHNFDKLSPKAYLNEPYKVYSMNEVNLYEPTKEQKKYIENPDYPLLCIGLAGSGKTTVSVYKYQQILNDYLYDKNVTRNDLVFLTFNTYVKDSAQAQLKTLGIDANCLDISSFFSTLIMNYSDMKVQGVYEFERWFKEEYLTSKSNKKIKFINVLSKKKEIVSTVYTYFRGVYKGSMLDWERTIFNQPLCKNDFKRIIEQKGNSVSLSQDDKEAIFDVCKEYDDYLKKNRLKDENDLALDVIQKVSKEKEKPLFDHIIVDEVQDLTEVQLYAILLCSKDYKIYLYGDQNQVINPTVFNMNKIDGALMKASSQKNIKIRKDIKLQTTFRSGPLLVKYLNQLIDIRKNQLGTSEYDDEVKAYFKSKDKYWARYIVDNKLIEEALKCSSKDPHSAIIVNNEEQKEELINKYKDYRLKIFTVYEAKGLEWDKVILYNLMSYEKEYYEDIIKGEVKNSLIHRMIFNRYYVGCTRAVQTFLVLESDLSLEVEKVMLHGMDKITKLEIVKTQFSAPDKNSYADWYNSGNEYFLKSMYSQAKIYYETALDGGIVNKNIEANLKLADYMDKFIKGKEEANSDIARKLLDKGFPRAAIDVYRALNDYYQVALIKMNLNDLLSEEEIHLILNNPSTTEKQMKKLLYSSTLTNVINEIKNMKKDIFGGN